MSTIMSLATPDEIAMVLGWTHALWGGSRPLDEYRARTFALLETPWARERYRFYLGRDEAGEPVCACKRYSFDVVVGGKACRALGFGAVFTHPQARGRGHAAAMLRRLMEGADEAIAILYSDIDPAYYQQLSFAPLGGLLGEARALEGPRAFVEEGAAPPGHDPARFWAAAEGRAPAFHYVRSAPYWDYLVQRNGVRSWTYAPDGQPLGYVTGSHKPGRMVVADAGWAEGVDETAFWLAVRALAHQLAGPGAEVDGWLPASAVRAGFVMSAIEDGVPMAVSLDGTPVPSGVLLWELDHF